MRRCLLAPWTISLILLLLLPLLLAAALSLCYWDLVSPPRFAGWENYRALAQDSLFWKALRVTLTLTALQLPLELAGGFALGLLMAGPRVGAGAFRTICLLPSLISGVASALMGVWLFHPQGLVNQGLGYVGLPEPRWFLDPHYALIALWLLGVWGLGRAGLVFLAALQEVDGSLLEAARLDGASSWQQLRYIILPLLRPTFVFVAMTSIAASLQTFVGAYVATSGGPLHSTTTLVMYLYSSGFQQQRMGYAAAISMVTFALSFAAAYAVASMWEERS